MRFLRSTLLPGRSEAGCAARRGNRYLALLLMAFVTIATVYNVTNPLFEAPDEIWHYLFSKHVREHWQLPIQAESREGVISQQEAGQPPLFYVLGAVLTSRVGGQPAEEWLRSNPHASIGSPLSDGNKNRFVHSPSEDFPYREDYLAGHLLRLFSTLMGAGTVLFTYLIGRQLWPRRSELALGAAAINAFTPQFLYMSAAVNNDVPVAFFCSASLWLSVKMVRARRATFGDALGLGVLSSLATMTKSNAIIALPLALLALLLVGWRGRSVRSVVLPATIMVLSWAAVSAWWFVRNLIEYGDLTPLRRFLGRSNLYDQSPTLAEIGQDLGGLWASFWALFGWFSILIDDRIYWFFAALAVTAAIGLFVLGFDEKRRESLFNLEVGLVAAWFLLVGGSLLWYRLIVQAFQGRLLFAGISAVSLLLMLGLSGAVPARVAPVAVRLLTTTMAAIALALPFVYIIPNYAQSQPLPESREEGQIEISGALLGSEVRLEGYRLTSDSLTPGQTVELQLFWRALAPMERDYSVFVHLVDWRGRVLAQRDSFPEAGKSATSLWKAGNVYSDSHRLKVPPDTPVPSVIDLVTGLYLVDSMERLPVRLSDGSASTAVPLGRIRAVSTARSEFQMLGRVEVEFGGKALLKSYYADKGRARPGGVLEGILTWEARDTFSDDYTVFVQLLGPSGLLAQDDAQPRGGAFPTSAWRAGDIVSHNFQISIPDNLSSGPYRLIAGLYDVKTGTRVLTPTDDHADLGLVEVAAR